MLIGLRHAIVRIFLSMLVGIGVIAVLFRGRRNRTRVAEPVEMSTPVAMPMTKRRSTVRWAGPAFALLCLLFGIGLSVAFFGSDRAHEGLVTPLTVADAPGGFAGAVAPPETRADGTRSAGAHAPNLSGAPDGPSRQDASPSVGGESPQAPTFDVVRVEPNGEAVIAGRASPKGTVELLVDGKPVATAVADADGRFALMPHTLPTGNSEVGLRATDTLGRVRRSSDSVAVAVSPSRAGKPLVALTSPDRSTVVLSRPGTPTAIGTAPDAALGRQTMTMPSPTLPGRATDGIRAPGSIAPGTGKVAHDTASPDGPGLGSSNGGTANPQAENVAAEADGPGVANGLGKTSGSETTVAGGRADSTDANKANPSIDPQGVDPKAAAVGIASIDAQDGGRLFVTGHAAAGSAVRLYLNDTLIAPAAVGRDGTVTFTIGRGVKPGAYKVRLDQVDAATGKVRSRVEVPFTMPDGERIAATDRPAAEPSGNAGGGVVERQAKSDASSASASTTVTDARPRDATGPVGPPPPSDTGPATANRSSAPDDPSRDAAGSSDVFVSEVRTARIERGDSLWEISRRTYGAGDRYTVIYDANQDQIRDPDLIYPGQILVLPGEDATEVGKEDKRG